MSEPGTLSRFTVYRRNKPKYRKHKEELEKALRGDSS